MIAKLGLVLFVLYSVQKIDGYGYIAVQHGEIIQPHVRGHPQHGHVFNPEQVKAAPAVHRAGGQPLTVQLLMRAIQREIEITRAEFQLADMKAHRAILEAQKNLTQVLVPFEKLFNMAVRNPTCNELAHNINKNLTSLMENQPKCGFRNKLRASKTKIIDEFIELRSQARLINNNCKGKGNESETEKCIDSGIQEINTKIAAVRASMTTSIENETKEGNDCLINSLTIYTNAIVDANRQLTECLNKAAEKPVKATDSADVNNGKQETGNVDENKQDGDVITPAEQTKETPEPVSDIPTDPNTQDVNADNNENGGA